MFCFVTYRWLGGMCAQDVFVFFDFTLARWDVRRRRRWLGGMREKERERKKERERERD